MKKSGFGYVLLWLVLICTVLGVSQWNKKGSSAPSPTISATPAVTLTPTPLAEEKEGELAGIWIPYMALETSEGTEAAFKANFERMADTAKALGVNTLFVHVRPFSDALYPSDYYPWSHLLTGTQGQDPGFDPLSYMLEYTHSVGMKFHAWINPLRVKTAQTPQLIAEDNPYAELSESSPYYFLNVEGNVYLNPAYKEVRKLIVDGISEIVEKYEVDGIHFDDYFYPENMGEADREAYGIYCENTEAPLPLEDWRTANVNTLISQVYREVKAQNSEASFGISPQGNIGNNKALGADVFSWCSTKGYIDYICPQLYFSYENPALGFTDALDSWMNIAAHDQLDIYIGLGLYKAGTDSDEGTWSAEDTIISRQIQDLRDAGCEGFVLYDILAAESEAAIAEMANAEALLKR